MILKFRLKGDKKFSSENYNDLVDYARKKFSLSLEMVRELNENGVCYLCEIQIFKIK